MKTYTVEVTRTVSFTKSYQVTATNDNEAIKQAETLADNDAWNDDMNGQEATLDISIAAIEGECF